MKEAWIDTNIIIRFVTADHAAMTPECADLMKSAEEGTITLKVPAMIIAECCWVLQSPRYQFSPRNIAKVLIDFLAADGIEADEKETLILALRAYADVGVDFIDAYLAAHARNSTTQQIITFNAKDFDKLKSTHARPSAMIN